MNIGINLYSKWPYQEVIQAFLENGINRTFVCVEHPNFDEAMKALEKANIEVICEGVETEEQNTLVSSSACDFVQGWYYSKALPLEECESFIDKYEKNRIGYARVTVDIQRNYGITRRKKNV